MTKSAFLVIRLGKLGDAIMTFPAIAALKTNLPDAVIDILTEEAYADLFRLHPAVNEIHAIPFLHYVRWKTRKLPSLIKSICKIIGYGYDTVIDLQDNDLITGLITCAAAGKVGYGFRNSWYSSLCYNRVDGKDDLNTKLDAVWESFYRLSANALPDNCYTKVPNRDVFADCIRIPDESSRWAGEEINKMPLHSTLIVMHSGAGEAHKVWPAEHFLELGKRLIEAHASGHIILLSGPCENIEEIEGLAISYERISFMTGLRITQMAALIQHADLFISTDTGPSHLAGILAVPRIVLVQPLANIDIWYDCYDNTHARYIRSSSDECRDCEGKRCNHSCMVHITTNEVFRLSQELLQ
jgi:ADP-heptose:LPS heptosyltransferase